MAAFILIGEFCPNRIMAYTGVFSRDVDISGVEVSGEIQT